jgi:hypothetical protein
MNIYKIEKYIKSINIEQDIKICKLIRNIDKHLYSTDLSPEKINNSLYSCDDLLDRKYNCSNDNDRYIYLLELYFNKLILFICSCNNINLKLIDIKVIQNNTVKVVGRDMSQPTTKTITSQYMLYLKIDDFEVNKLIYSNTESLYNEIHR